MAGKKMSEVKAEPQGAPDLKTTVRTLRNSLNKDDDDKVTWDLTKDDSPTFVKNWISTGSTILDIVISNRRGGGIPVGKITELQGEESSGKSLLCAHIIRDTQRRGGIAVYLDTENAANPDFMKRIGVDLEKLIYVQPGTIEKAFEIMEGVISTIRAKAPNQLLVILWDSVGNTPPQAEIEGDYDPNSRIGLGAKAMAKGLRKITDLIGKEQIALVCTQPLKFAMGGNGYGDPWITVYGKALPYHSSLRLRVQASTKLKDKNDVIYGLKTHARVIKSRLGTSYRTCKFEIHFDHGIDDEASWFEVLHEAGLIEKDAGWCYIDQLPSGRLWDKPGSKHHGKDRGTQFREAAFGELCRTDQKVREWALDTLEKLLIVKYDDKRPIREGGEEIPNDDEGPVLPPSLGSAATLLVD